MPVDHAICIVAYNRLVNTLLLVTFKALQAF